MQPICAVNKRVVHFDAKALYPSMMSSANIFINTVVAARGSWNQLLQRLLISSSSSNRHTYAHRQRCGHALARSMFGITRNWLKVSQNWLKRIHKYRPLAFQEVTVFVAGPESLPREPQMQLTPKLGSPYLPSTSKIPPRIPEPCYLGSYKHTSPRI